MCTPETNTVVEQENIEPVSNNSQTKEASSMKSWDMDIIIAWGLVMMGIISIIGWIAYSILTGNSNGTEIPMAIVSGLTGALAGRHLPRKDVPTEYPVNNSRCNYPSKGE
jgi:hypothetical protein